MDSELIMRALCFHGKPMQRIWDEERGAGDLKLAGVPEDGNYSLYVERQKYFTFQDRSKRLKLHQLLASKASELYGKAPAKPIKLEHALDNKRLAAIASLPPFEIFLTKYQEKVRRCALESIKTGDIIYAQVVQRKRGVFALSVQPLCTEESNLKLLQDCAIKCNIPFQLCGPPTDDNQATTQQVIDINAYVRCEVVDFSIDADRMTLSLTPSTTNKNIKLGKIPATELPALYRKLMKNPKRATYEGFLKEAKEINNPNYDILYAIHGLNVNEEYTLMSSLKRGFPKQQYAKEIRQQQTRKWAFRSVSEGIDFFKIGKHDEAFQCLNKALNIDPRNVEGWVARGALYTNKGLFLKAVDDFEKALKLNSFHVNARKCMGETLVALGRSYEEDNRIQDASKAYRDCLNYVPKHDQASKLLEAIQQRTGTSVNISSSLSTDEKQYDATDHLNKLNSSPRDGSDSERSSDSDSDSEDEISAEKNTNSTLSPLSKKMALHFQQMESTGCQKQLHQPFYMSSTNTVETYTQRPLIPNVLKLDEDDTESRFRKLLEDASNHKKDKQTLKVKKAKKSKPISKEPTKSIEYSYIIKAESTQNGTLQQNEKSMQELKNRQQKLTEKPSTSFDNGSRTRNKSETPPPALGGSNAVAKKFRPVGQRASTQATVAHAASLEQKFSFQIKKPVKIDQFGLTRLGIPAHNKSLTPPFRNNRSRSRRRSQKRPHSRKYSRSRSKSRPRRRSRSAGRCCRWRSRTRSNSRGRYVGRRGRRSYSSSSTRSGSVPHKRRYDGRSFFRGGIRRTSSPFVPRATPSPRTYKRRSRSPRGSFGWSCGRGCGGSGPPYKFGNRDWKNPNKEESPESSKISP